MTSTIMSKLTSKIKMTKNVSVREDTTYNQNFIRNKYLLIRKNLNGLQGLVAKYEKQGTLNE